MIAFGFDQISFRQVIVHSPEYLPTVTSRFTVTEGPESMMNIFVSVTRLVADEEIQNIPRTVSMERKV